MFFEMETHYLHVAVGTFLQPPCSWYCREKEIQKAVQKK